ncbi:MAG: AAA family ATPase [Clostridia bacterium]|nr:AAA family ATPase [Clostridia bacterium]
MENTVVRISKITINNFKNVVNGDICFENTRKDYKASVLGLYGQNGSGKTALIDAVSLLKLALCGLPIPVKYADYVNVGAEYASIKYELKIIDKSYEDEKVYSVSYAFSFKKVEAESADVIGITDDTEQDFKFFMFDEVLSYLCVGENGKASAKTVIDTRLGDVFSPKKNVDIFTGKNKSSYTDMIVEKKLASAMSKSFIYSKAVLNILKNNCTDECMKNILLSLSDYGADGLFVVDTSNVGLAGSFNILPVFRRNTNAISNGKAVIPLNDDAVVPQESLDMIKKVVSNMNIVLAQLVPGLTLSVKNFGTHSMKNGNLGYRIQLVSNKNSREIPIQYESEGIKKLIAILQLLIAVYNNPSMTVAIDELDSGVFEYLLGEILRIISEKGKGQLIFTSHNLRPLETIDRGFIAFTTTNPARRYIRMSNMKKSVNLRDFYYRDIVLGEQKEAVYDPTDNSEIAFAFREAGDYCEP